MKTAVGELLLERGYAELTVQAITDRADLGYGTFYLHYTNIDDAVWDVVLDVMRGENARIDQAMQEMSEDGREYLGWYLLFAFLDDKRERYLELFGSKGSAELRKRYQAYMTGVYERGMRTETYSPRIDVPIEFLTQFMAGATIQLLLWWMETPNAYTPVQMASMLYRTFYRSEPPTIALP